MYFEKNLSLKQRLFVTGVLLAVTPIVCIGLVVHRQFSVLVRTAEEGSSKLAAADLDHLTETVYQTAASHQNDILDSLHVARGMLASYGGLTFSRHRHIRWQATNEATHETGPKTLPAVTIGRKSRRSATPQAALADAIGEVSGAVCTIFQRMNPSGDMLRIATNTGKAGTYIPATNPDRSPNPVIQSILRKQQFTGKQNIAGLPLFTAYEAITKSDGEVVGMLYVGLPETVAATKLRAIKIGGDSNIEILALSTGNLFKSAASHPQHIVEQRYDSPQHTPMIAHLRYFAPWNWVLGVAIPEPQYLQTPRQIHAIANQSRQWIGWVFLISLLSSTLIWLRYAVSFARPFTAFAKRLQQDTGKLVQTSREIAQTAQQQIEGTTRHAGAIEQTSQSSTTLHQSAKRNLGQAAAALSIAGRSDKYSQEATEHLDAMQWSMADIGSANTKIAGIMKSIDEIAFQSRILALNASIEAARAGEAGVSFAVVASEFGKLARRCAEASQATTDVVSGCRKSTDAGAEKLKELNSAVRQMTDNAASIKSSIQDVHAATERQTRIIGDISSALHKMEDVVLHNAASKAQKSNAGKRINAQAGVLREGALELSRLVHGKTSDRGWRSNSVLLPRKNQQTADLLPKRAQHLHIGAAVNARVAVLNVDHANNFVLRNNRNG